MFVYKTILCKLATNLDTCINEFISNNQGFVLHSVVFDSFDFCYVLIFSHFELTFSLNKDGDLFDR